MGIYVISDLSWSVLPLRTPAPPAISRLGSVASSPQSRRSGERPEGERDAAIHIRIFSAYDRARIRFKVSIRILNWASPLPSIFRISSRRKVPVFYRIKIDLWWKLRVSWRRDGEIRVPKGHWVWELWSHQVDEEQGDEGARRRQVPTQRGNGSVFSPISICMECDWLYSFL